MGQKALESRSSLQGAATRFHAPRAETMQRDFRAEYQLTVRKGLSAFAREVRRGSAPSGFALILICPRLTPR